MLKWRTKIESYDKINRGHSRHLREKNNDGFIVGVTYSDLSIEEAAKRMEQSIPTPAAASALVSETQTAVAQANAAVNKSKNLLKLAENANAIAKKLRNMTSTAGGRRRRHRTHRRRN
jgi:hypothetical protein